MRAVEKSEYIVPVKIGIGTERQEKALLKFGCEKVFFPHELEQVIEDKGLPMHMVFRPEDTVVMAQPNLLKPDWFRKIIATGAWWQVPGHDPVRFESEDDRSEWRKLKPKKLRVQMEKDNRGRKSKWPVPTREQIAAMVALWHSGKKRSLVIEQIQEMVGAEVPAHWVRDIIIKETGSAKRSPEGR